MGFLRKIAGYLGFARDDGHEVKDDDDDDHHNHHHHHHHDDPNRNRSHFKETGQPLKGFSVPVQVAVDRSHPGPLLAPSDSGDGGVQGLKWYTKRLRVDEDGDVADEFFDELAPETSTSTETDRKPLSRFQLKYSTRPARVKKQAISQDGRVQLCVEHQGRLQWV